MENNFSIGDLVKIKFRSISDETYIHEAIGVLTSTPNSLCLLVVVKHLTDKLHNNELAVVESNIVDMELLSKSSVTELNEDVNCYTTTYDGNNIVLVTDGFIKGFRCGKSSLEKIKKEAITSYILLKHLDDDRKSDYINVFLSSQRKKGNKVDYYEFFQKDVLKYDTPEEFILETYDDFISYEYNGISFAKIYFDETGMKLYLYPDFNKEPLIVEDVFVDDLETVNMLYNGNPPLNRTSTQEAANRTIVAYYNLLYNQKEK